jgi:DNA repair exonuclease SbcCD nuclease subunit
MSRIIILGDYHFGLRKNNKLFHDILMKELEWSFSIIKKDDIIIILGDVFESRSAADFKILNDAWDYFIRLSRSCKEVYILAGNHDEYYKDTSRENTNCRFLEFEPSSDSKISPVRVITELSEIKLNNKSCLFIPWIDSEEKKNAAKAALGGKFDLIFGHFDLIGLYSKTERDVNVLAFDVSDFPKESKVFSGHYHKRVTKENIQYVGSFVNSTFNDVDEIKGLYVIDNDNVSFIENNCPKFRYMTIDNPLAFIKAYNSSNTVVKSEMEKIIHGNFVKLFLNEYKKENEDVYKIIKSMSPIEIIVSFNRITLEEEPVEEFGGFDPKTDITIVLNQYLDTIKEKLPTEVKLEDIKKLIEMKSSEYRQLV